jgi:pimeloyl-ACP methyl ester carboxylesterase
MPSVRREPVAMAKANGIELCHEIFGEAGDPPLLLIMGLGAQMVLWDDEFCEMLALRGFRVIRFDNRDIGQSTRMSGGEGAKIMALIQAHLMGQTIAAPYTLRDMADDAVGLLDALGIARAHVVGASMGGAIGQEMAMAHGKRMLSFTAIMASSGAPGLPAAKPEAIQVLMTPPPATKAEYVAVFKRNWRVLRAGTFPADEARDAARAERIFERGLNPAGVARQFMAILASGNRKPGLAAITVPTLVIHGRADPLVPHEHGADIARSIPGARLHSIDDMGHALAMPHWAEIVEAIAGHARG